MANFINHLDHFRTCCKKVIALEFNPNWSLYENVCAIAGKLNEVISAQNLVIDQVNTLTIMYQELKDYVNNYFDNLDVQDEINKKLDELLESGELGDLIDEWLQDLANDYVRKDDPFSTNIFYTELLGQHRWDVLTTDYTYSEIQSMTSDGSYYYISACTSTNTVGKILKFDLNNNFVSMVNLSTSGHTKIVYSSQLNKIIIYPRYYQDNASPTYIQTIDTTLNSTSLEQHEIGATITNMFEHNNILYFIKNINNWLNPIPVFILNTDFTISTTEFLIAQFNDGDDNFVDGHIQFFTMDDNYFYLFRSNPNACVISDYNGNAIKKFNIMCFDRLLGEVEGGYIRDGYVYMVTSTNAKDTNEITYANVHRMNFQNGNFAFSQSHNSKVIDEASFNVYVNNTYTGFFSDGTQAYPFKDIQSAVGYLRHNRETHKLYYIVIQTAGTYEQVYFDNMNITFYGNVSGISFNYVQAYSCGSVRFHNIYFNRLIGNDSNIFVSNSTFADINNVVALNRCNYSEYNCTYGTENNNIIATGSRVLSNCNLINTISSEFTHQGNQFTGTVALGSSGHVNGNRLFTNIPTQDTYPYTLLTFATMGSSFANLRFSIDEVFYNFNIPIAALNNTTDVYTVFSRTGTRFTVSIQVEYSLNNSSLNLVSVLRDGVPIIEGYLNNRILVY